MRGFTSPVRHSNSWLQSGHQEQLGAVRMWPHLKGIKEAGAAAESFGGRADDTAVTNVKWGGFGLPSFGWILANYHNTAWKKVRAHCLEFSSSPQRPFCSKSQTCAGLSQCRPLLVVVHGTQHCDKSALFALSWRVCLPVYFCLFLLLFKLWINSETPNYHSKKQTLLHTTPPPPDLKCVLGASSMLVSMPKWFNKCPMYIWQCI